MSNSAFLNPLAFKNPIKSGQINSARHIDKDFGGKILRRAMGLYSAQVKLASSLTGTVAIKFVLAFLKNVIRMQGEAYEKEWDYL